ncbi:MAG: ABC transporter ATP-binding protein [Anaerolineae bacterium]|nr:ABC transporter ATP-binding protein [Anaerolineae bacterium]
MNADLMIEVHELTKKFGSVAAVNHISFNVKPNEIIGILGPNGAGKTTTLRMLTGYMPPTSGSAMIAGYDILEDSLEVRQRVGYLPEQVPVYPDMTVRGYVTFWAELRGLRKSRARVDEVLAMVQLESRANSLIRNLSKGMRQRLGLAQAIVHDPPVIILDEPTIGIDPEQVIEVRESVRQLRQNHTILFSTHILSEAEQICDRVLILNAGRIVAAGAPAGLRQQLQAGDHLFAVISGSDTNTIRQTLARISGVESVEVQEAGYTLRVTPGMDIRADVSDAIIQAGYRLLELRPVAMTLEDIFLDIVGRTR